MPRDKSVTYEGNLERAVPEKPDDVREGSRSKRDGKS